MKPSILKHFSLIIFTTINLMACQHLQTRPSLPTPAQAPSGLVQQDVSVVFIPENQRLPPHVIYERQQVYAFSHQTSAMPFKVEMVLNPLIHNPVITAQVEKNGRIERKFVAKKSSTSLLTDKKTSWAQTRSKLALLIPYVTPDETVVIKTSYEWMDIRWLNPILMQEDGSDTPIEKSNLTVDVPYGITLQYKAAKDRNLVDFAPKSSPHETSLWTRQDNRSGLGMRYQWEALPQIQSTSSLRADLLQILLSFETPEKNDTHTRFDNWSSVASFLYDRVERYDMPSNEIRDFAIRETKSKENNEQKINRIFTFLKNDIEKRFVSGTYQEQEVQPATRTFARRFGTPFDIAILGKALVSSIGLEADVVVAADSRYNPNITDLFSPAIFSSVLLAVYDNQTTYYFDPEETELDLHQLRPSRQGQAALPIKPKNAHVYTLPFDSAEKNVETHSYQLWMNDEGLLEGEYSIDLSGIEAQNFINLTEDQLRLMSANAVETKILGNDSAPFSFETVEFSKEKTPTHTTIKAFGLVKPRLLAKNADGQYELRLDKVINPVKVALIDSLRQNYSSTTKVSLFVSLPEKYIVENLPNNINISIDGIDMRISATNIVDQLIVEGTAIVSLPLKKDSLSTINNELNNITLYGEQNLKIHNFAATAIGTPDDHQKSGHKENS